MWPNFFTGLPFLFPSLGRINYNTLPVTNVTVGTEAVTLELPIMHLEIEIMLVDFI